MLKTRTKPQGKGLGYVPSRFTEQYPAHDGFVGRRMGTSVTGWSALVAGHFRANPMPNGEAPWNVSHHTLDHSFRPALCRVSAIHPVKNWNY